MRSRAFWNGGGVPHVPWHSTSLESCGTPPQLTDDEESCGPIVKVHLHTFSLSHNNCHSVRVHSSPCSSLPSLECIWCGCCQLKMVSALSRGPLGPLSIQSNL